jgi:hypothetical protein
MRCDEYHLSGVSRPGQENRRLFAGKTQRNIRATEAVQRRLDEDPQPLGGDARRSSILRHDQGANGSHHFLVQALPRVAAEVARYVLAHNLTRVINIILNPGD